MEILGKRKTKSGQSNFTRRLPMNPIKELLPWQGWDGQISVFGFIRYSRQTNCVTYPISAALSGQVPPREERSAGSS